MLITCIRKPTRQVLGVTGIRVRLQGTAYNLRLQMNEVTGEILHSGSGYTGHMAFVQHGTDGRSVVPLPSLSRCTSPTVILRPIRFPPHRLPSSRHALSSTLSPTFSLQILMSSSSRWTSPRRFNSFDSYGTAIHPDGEDWPARYSR
jgi:hypothetical protein